MAERSSSTNRVLVISHDVVGQQMAGPGIRYYHLARVLADEFETILAIPDSSDGQLSTTEFEVVRYNLNDWQTLEPTALTVQVIIFPSDITNIFPKLNQLNIPLVIDGYDPLLVEWLALHNHLPPEEYLPHWDNRMADLGKQYLAGDFFICASERQRDWWIGLLEAHGRINPHTFQENPSLRKLIDLVPFGLSDVPPKHTRPIIKGVWPGIAQDDKLILWGGGLWPWLDPLTAVRAIAKVHEHRPEVRLIFPGTRHPNPIHENIVSHNEGTKQLAQELGLLDTVVFFGDWVPYSDWSNVLLESDVALSLHYDSLETRLAFRSRIFDYIWAGLPTVATHGDATSDLLARFSFNRLVDDGDAEGVATAILELLDSPKQQFTTEFAQARQQLTWQEAARPLVAFCHNPRIAPDKAAIITKNRLAPSVTSETVNGIPMDSEETAQLLIQKDAEIDHFKQLVAGYERGRFIRFMRWLHQQKQSSTYET